MDKEKRDKLIRIARNIVSASNECPREGIDLEDLLDSDPNPDEEMIWLELKRDIFWDKGYCEYLSLETREYYFHKLTEHLKEEILWDRKK